MGLGAFGKGVEASDNGVEYSDQQNIRKMCMQGEESYEDFLARR